jgi:uncharacterized protein (DUF983 family)
MRRISQLHYLLYGNRVVIYICSLIALFYDVNLAYVLALTLWLWMPQFLQLELNIIKVIKGGIQNLGNGKRIKKIV